MFLGPIHYWLYKKIGNQEELTTAIAEDAKQHGWISDTADYVKVLPALESVIDEKNIHGWLQDQIADAETRYADLISAAADHLESVKQTAFAFGERNAVSSDADVEEIYQYFEDFFVNGMPCDRVNEVTEQTGSSVSWKMNQDIHAQYCKDSDSEKYYEIRKAVMDGMLRGTDYSVEMQDRYHYTLMK
jgi:hypothetical protein